MNTKRLRFVLLAIPFVAVAVLTVGADTSHPATAGGGGDAMCNLAIPCIEYDNNGTGPGIRASSLSGNGIGGGTKFNSTSLANARAGSFGGDYSTSGSFNSGVKGTSTRGTGVSGLSTNGAGVTGQSTNGPGLSGASSNNDGVYGFTTNSIPTSGSPHSGVFGFDNSSDGGHGNSGVGGFSTFGVGVKGNSPNWVGVDAVGGGFDFGIGEDFPALSIVGNNGSSHDLIDACEGGTEDPCGAFHSAFKVDGSGVVYAKALAVGINSAPFGSVNISGQYLKSGSCVAGCAVATTASVGRAMVTYSPMVSQPTVEDFGEAQLIGGQSHVHLDPKFANMIDQRANYLVFITSEGDANTLYVIEKTLGGFTVRESHAGRSTIGFSYRIVAKPFGSHEARLPMVELPKLRMPGGPTHTRPLHAFRR